MKRVVVVAGAVCFLCAALSASFAQEIAADMVTKDGKKAIQGKLYVKGNKIRVEQKGDMDYRIFRGDKNAMWNVMPGDKAWMALKVDPKMKPKAQEKMDGEVSRKQVGTETVDGHPTKKYEVVAKEEGKNVTYYQWLATDLNNFPVKTANANGKWSVEYTNIKKVGVADSLFEVPKGYASLDAPDLVGGGH
jgi:hypothetical protein